ncbi:MAG: glycosyltransferase family 4 protein [Candidatus Eisenbacteria bacterium]|nr:glycosyltransferase family 4 protein [Candidatus Eisenbacteria bacterium]
MCKTEEKFETTVKGKILMFAYFFPPLGGGGVQRTSKFVKYLPSFGWLPAVVTVNERAYWVKDNTLRDDVPSGVDVVRTSAVSVFHLLRFVPGGGSSGGEGQRSGALFSFLRKVSSFFLIPDQYVGWVPFAVSGARQYMRRHPVSVIYSTSSPDSSHLAALLTKRLCSKPWVADFRDPWTERLTFASPTRVHLRLHRFLEAAVLRNADRVVCTSEEIMRDFLNKYPRLEPRKFHVITNGFDSEDFAGTVALATQFTISHTGILTGKRNAFGFLEGLRLFLEQRPDARPKMRVSFVGPRDSENEVKAEELNLLDVVSFRGSLPHRECVALQRSSQVLLLIEDDSPRGAMIYPAKVFEYGASGRPILALLPEGAASRFVRELKAGTVCSPSDPLEISRAISSFFSAHEAGTPLNGIIDKGLLAAYERRELTKQLARLLAAFEKTAESPQSGPRE